MKKLNAKALKTNKSRGQAKLTRALNDYDKIIEKIKVLEYAADLAVQRISKEQKSLANIQLAIDEGRAK